MSFSWNAVFEDAKKASQRAKMTGSSNTFDLQQFLRSKDGKEWLQSVQVQDSNQKSFSYYAPSVAWEDIHRTNGSSMGDFIFDVTMSIKDNTSNNAQNVCCFSIFTLFAGCWLIHFQTGPGSFIILSLSHSMYSMYSLTDSVEEYQIENNPLCLTTGKHEGSNLRTIHSGNQHSGW